MLKDLEGRSQDGENLLMKAYSLMEELPSWESKLEHVL